MTKEIKYNNDLGKGEVLSSILSGSTRNPLKNRLFDLFGFRYSAVSSRTEREDARHERGVSVEKSHFVPRKK